MLNDHRIVLHTIDAIHLVHASDILFCKCDNSSTTFNLTNGATIVVSRGIKEFELQLADSGFIRTHQSFLVNKDHITSVRKTNNYALVLSDKTQIPVSTRKRKEILQILTRN